VGASEISIRLEFLLAEEWWARASRRVPRAQHRILRSEGTNEEGWCSGVVVTSSSIPSFRAY